MMDIFEYADDLQYGELHMKTNPETGLHAIVAIHNVERGPAIGGCRFIEYDGTEEALRDAMRLARGMTYKAAISNLPHGGAKSVLIRPKNLDDEQREAIFEEFGEFVDSLNGQYITAEDSGTTVGDMNTIRRHTDHVLGYSSEEGGSGDPSPFTAHGVRRGIEAAAKFEYDRDTLNGLRIAIQGVGSVGYNLAKELDNLGADLWVTDVDQDAIDRCVEEFDATAVELDEIFDVDCDIFAPCALGAVLDDDTIERLNCDIVAGAANNQLAEPRHDAVLRKHGILYAPDYAINAAGLINVAESYAGYDGDRARQKIEAIYDTMLEIFERAEREDAPTGFIANTIAEERFED